MVSYIRSDLEFILEQILIAEAGGLDGSNLVNVLPNMQVPWGLRTVTGEYNNLVLAQSQFGAADTLFPRLLDPVFRDDQDGDSISLGPPPAPTIINTNYGAPGDVVDADPRIISNLIVDQTPNNPAAVAANDANPGGQLIMSPGLDGIFGTADDTPVFFIPNITPDEGLGAPFNAWMTFFGQFFDHGLDLVTKGGNGTVWIPLQDDDPLVAGNDGVFGTEDDLPPSMRFMVLTRATTFVGPGADGILGTDDDTIEHENTTSPFVDQNQTYTSHPSHQVFLRAYEIGPDGAPHATGKLIENRDVGADGVFGTGDDEEIGGMATWAVVKAQARDILGIELTDDDVFNVPLLATDAYGNFIKGPNGFPQLVVGFGADGILGTADDDLVEGNPENPVNPTAVGAFRTGHQFLIDIAHGASPLDERGNALIADSDGDIGGPVAPGFYDNELLDAHYIAGDGRVNENIGLTAVHAIFHSEHNRLVDHTKAVLLSPPSPAEAASALALLNGYLLVPVESFPLTQAEIDALVWDGERLFQAAKFGTEMQYQHLVFEEFARTVQPMIDEFLAPNGYDTTIDASIVAEFAHTVYRFGHSMLTEQFDRLDADFNSSEIGLIAAFLNPLAFVESGSTPEEATSAIVRGLTRQVGNEIDEFVTEALRNNLLGLPLDLAAINITRGRDTGVPPLNAARAQFYQMTGDSQLRPYISWVDFAANLKHVESLVNFIAAYGTHASIVNATTLADKRAAAMLIVFGGEGAPADRLDFLNSTGDWANNAGKPKDVDGVTTTGLGSVDFWIGGLAERQMPFGGLLGSTFNFVFETQLESLQNGDRFYYLSRTAGMNFGTELEQNSFAKMIMLNTNVKHLPDAVFTTPAFILEVDQSQQFTGLGESGRDDPTGGRSINGVEILPLVIRDNPNTPGPDTNYLHYTGVDHVVLGGTPGDDIIISSEGDDTLYGDEGNDRLEGGFGNDVILGGAGDDILTDIGGDNNIQGGDGNDVIVVSVMEAGGAGQLILGGAGKDFIATFEDISTTFGGLGDDFIYSAKTSLPPTGNEGDDWIEWGTQDGAPGDNFAPFLADDVPGNDIFIGGGGFDEMIGEGGDDIFVGSDAQDKMDGMSGYDWVTYKNDRFGVTADLGLAIFGGVGEIGDHIALPFAASPQSILDRFAEVEGLSGTAFTDILRGDNVDATTIINHGGATGGALTNLDLIDGLRALLESAGIDTTVPPPEAGYVAGNIILGGDGSDIIEGRGGDDLIDGDKWLNVRISVRANTDGTGPEIATYDSMVPLIPLMLNGTYNPGQLVAVREIKDGNGQFNFDTAVFSGNFEDYTVIVDDNGTPLDLRDDIVTVIDNVVGRDGIDRLVNIERLQFADQSITLVPGLNEEPLGQPTILDAATNTPLANNTPTEGQLLRVSIAGVTDPDNVSPTNPTGAITGQVAYVWQVERRPGTGVFEDIIDLPAGDLAFQSANGSVFRVTPDLAGLALRVKAVFQDANGVPEQVFSIATEPVIDVPDAPPAPLGAGGPEITAGGAGIRLIRSDLDFILEQIRIAEAHAAGADLLSLVPNIRSSAGLRTVSGEYNNLVDFGGASQTHFGAADNLFPRATTPIFRPAEAPPPGFGPPIPTSYAQTNGGLVFDSQPRIISNLIVDQTMNNPAAIAAALRNAGSEDIWADTQAFLAALQAIEEAEAQAAANLIAFQQALEDAQNAIPGFEQAVADALVLLDEAEANDALALAELNAATAAQADASAALLLALLAAPPGTASTDPGVLAALEALDEAADVTAAAQAAKDATAAIVQEATEAVADAQIALAQAHADVTAAQEALDAALAGDPDVAAAHEAFDELVAELGLKIVTSPGLDGQFGTADDKQVFQIDNISPDVGLSAPFNAWMTFFGQFFDHGLDLVTKGNSGTIFMPLQPDDPLYDPDSPTNFLVLTRATQFVDENGVIQHQNTTSPFVDQNQTYSSHPSHQVFLRAYEMGPDGTPRPTGKLLENRDIGPDGIFGTADDVHIGGMATWGVLKAQARDMLGIELTDADVGMVPLLKTDLYGNFIPGPNGFPQVVVGLGPDNILGTEDDLTVEGDPQNPINLAEIGAFRTPHAFLDDIAHAAVPVLSNGVLQPDADDVAGNAVPAGQYDDELLNAHYVAGDGRVNENIGLTAVHAIFHSEHNRLVNQTKGTIALSNDLAFINEWLLTPLAAPPVIPPDLDVNNVAALNAWVDSLGLDWNGERLFQVAKFGTEMQYQHLVFEEFARTIQPNVDPFFAPTQVYDVDLDASIVAEFAHTVYRFGHSMLTETVDRYDPFFNVVSDPNDPEGQQIGLIQAFLNPLAYAASGPTPEEATGALVRGLTRTVGNEIDEFVTEALRNNLLGLPLDLAAINLARGRDTGVAPLNAVRRQIYDATGESMLKPYTSWIDFFQHLKNPESLINFIAAYGTHPLITGATTLVEKREAALLIILGGEGAPEDRLDFLNSTGAWANDAGKPKDVDGVTTTGLGTVDLWIGGLAEEKMPFGGMLGSTFNFIFENQLEKLQDGDRFYYLERTAGLAFNAELEGNSFAKLIMANSDATHLPALVFSTPTYILEVNQSRQFNTGLGNADPTGDNPLVPLVIRDNPNTPGADTNYLHYTGGDHVVLGGTPGDDILIAGDGDDTLYGDEGNDRLDGGFGNDTILGGAGDDIITDLGGDDVIQGGDGNDVIHGGNGVNLIIGGFGSDFIITGEDANESFGGPGNDFILGTKADEQNMGNEGDDWIEGGTSDGAPGDNFDPLGNDPIAGNDVYIGRGESDKFNAEGGDDIMVGSVGLGDRYIGASGYDWATFKNDPFGVTIDLTNRFFDQPPVPGSGASVLTRFDFVEGLSGSAFGDALYGDNSDAASLRNAGAQGSVLTNFALIDGLEQLLDVGELFTPVIQEVNGVRFFDGGNIILGGGGGDIIEGRGGDDFIDGDAWLNVRISVRQNIDGTGPEIATFDSMVPMIPFMLNGTYNPGQLKIVREILYATDGSFDTAVFSGNAADYIIELDDNGTEDISDDIVRVTDTVAGRDGIDTLKHIERLLFADQAIVLGGLNNVPVGQLTITGTPQEGQTLTVSIAGVTDADNITPENETGAILGPVSYFWQIERVPGSNVFEDLLTDFTAGEIARVSGMTFTPGDGEAGLRLRVRAVYKDGNGVLEQVFSAPTAPIGNINDPPTAGPTINDTTPTEGQALTANPNTIVDPDGTDDAVTAGAFTFQWQQSADGGVTWTDIPGATGQLFVPEQAQVGLLLRVAVTFVDDGGTTETAFSAPTDVVGDLIIDNNASNVLVGTAGQDTIFGQGGADNIQGLAGNDTLDGGNGADTLQGGDGNDTLIGGPGADQILGGAGNDLIIYNFGDGADTVDGGAGTDTLSITGTFGDDVLNVVFDGTALVQFENGTVTGVEFVTADLLDGIDMLTYAGTAADVSVNLAAGTASGFASILGIVNVTGGTGNDMLTGDANANVLNGGAGNDTLVGGAGDDTLTGGAGDDTLSGGLGLDTLSGGGGNDTASYAGETDAFFIDLAAGTARRGSAAAPVEDTLASIENVIGGSGDDTITSAAGAQVLDGGAGNDTLSSGAGNDTLIGGLGNDILVGGAGNDIIDGGAGDDTITWSVGDGRDIVNGGTGTDKFVINGSAANETFRIETVADYLARTGANPNTLQPGTEIVVSRATGAGLGTVLAELTGIDDIDINGGGGNDTFIVSGDFTNTDLNPNTMTFHGSGGNDTVDVTGRKSGHRVVFVSNGGDDMMLGEFLQTDEVDLGSQTPTFVNNNNGTSSLITPMGKVTGPTGSPYFAEYSQQAGDPPPANSPPGDPPPGGGQGGPCGNPPSASVQKGTNGNDTLNGGDGNDTLKGLKGNDTLNGGAGNDTLCGDDGNDNLHGDGGNDNLYGGKGNDNLYGGHGNDNLYGGDGNDSLYGDGGNDNLYGDSGNDHLYGGAGNDHLYGGSGKDRLEGGAGDDVLDGGAGNDTFVFKSGFGHDTIVGFSTGGRCGGDRDVIEIDKSIFSNFAELAEYMKQVGKDTVITTVDGESSITLEKIKMTTLDADDFRFV